MSFRLNMRRRSHKSIPLGDRLEVCRGPPVRVPADRGNLGGITVAQPLLVVTAPSAWLIAAKAMMPITCASSSKVVAPPRLSPTRPIASGFSPSPTSASNGAMNCRLRNFRAIATRCGKTARNVLAELRLIAALACWID